MAMDAATIKNAPPSPPGHSGDQCAAAKRLVEAIAARDYKGIFAAFAPEVRFRYLIPPGPGEVVGAAEVAARYFQWFGDAAAINVESMLVQPLAQRTSVRYHFQVHRNDGWDEIEQQAYIDMDGELRITALDLLCSGFRSMAEEDPMTSSGTHRFDAGTLGCADGLAQEFRRRILAIPVGDALVVETSDPAANADLPPLARMMGHKVVSVEPSSDGRVVITVERGR